MLGTRAKNRIVPIAEDNYMIIIFYLIIIYCTVIIAAYFAIFQIAIGEMLI